MRVYNVVVIAGRQTHIFYGGCALLTRKLFHLLPLLLTAGDRQSPTPAAETPRQKPWLSREWG